MAIVPTLWLDSASLELRLNSLVAEEFRRPVLERLVAQRAPAAPESFPERILVFVEELAKILEPSSAWLDAHLWVAATREIVPCDPPSPSHHRVELHWPAEVSVDDLARWLNTSASDPSYAKNLTRLLHEFGQTDWAAIERLFSDAWRRNTMGPDAAPETVAKAAFRATFARISPGRCSGPTSSSKVRRRSALEITRRARTVRSSPRCSRTWRPVARPLSTTMRSTRRRRYTPPPVRSMAPASESAMA